VKTPQAAISRIVLLLCMPVLLVAADRPEKRVINRKNISHIVVSSAGDGYFVTLLVSDRFPYNYKSTSYPLYYRVSGEREGLALSEKLNKYLETGKNLTIYLNGSKIKKISYSE